MTLITKLVKFGVSRKDLVSIYILFIRSILEYCAVVWHSNLTCEQSANIERVQKVATSTILQDFNVPYETALRETG